MKVRGIRNILSLFLAVYFSSAGTGYNIVRYCCDSCQNAGIEKVAEGVCCEIHSHLAIKSDIIEEHTDFVCNDVRHISSECHLLRLSTDTPSIDKSSFSFDNNAYDAVNLQLFTLPSFCYPSYSPVKYGVQPPDIDRCQSGRTIITLHSVLLI